MTQGSGLGNLNAALGEAVWMLGMERNSDAVVMSSYAPLFVNVNDRKWNPDAIGFDAVHSYGTPSYYVQALFAAHRPERVLPTKTLSFAQDKPVPTGKIGVGTWKTQAEYRDIKVESGGKVLLTENFDKGVNGWQTSRGNWKVENGVFRQDNGSIENVFAVAGNPNWQNYTLTLKARKLSGSEGFLILFRTQDEKNWYWWNLGGWNNTLHAIERMQNGVKSLVAPQFPGRIETGKWYDVRVTVQGNHIQCFLDGKLLHDVEEKGLEPLHSLGGYDKKTGELILKVVNYGDTVQDTAIELGEGHGHFGGTVTTLSGSPEAENSLAQPHNIAPKTQQAVFDSSWFRYTFPSHSLTIFRLNPYRQ